MLTMKMMTAMKLNEILETLLIELATSNDKQQNKNNN